MRKHTVGKKECLASIAWEYGFQSWKKIYDDPANDKFRAKRPNPNVIHKGDEIIIPDTESKEVDGATEAKHKFKVKKDSWLFRVELLDEFMKGQECVPYRLTIEGVDPLEGTTGTNGLIEVPIPAHAEHGTLFALGRQIDLRFGGLNPIRQVSGVQQRLNSLGFNAGPVDGIPGPKTRKALAAFQTTQTDLKPTGLLDDDTLRRLIEVHDNDTRLSCEEKPATPPNSSTNADTGGVPGRGGRPDGHIVCHEPDFYENVCLVNELQIGVSVVSSYENTEGVPHYLSIRSLSTGQEYTERIENAADAVSKIHSLPYEFQEGEYEVRISTPFGIDITAPRQFENYQRGIVKTVFIRQESSNAVEFKVTRKQSILHDFSMKFHLAQNPNASGAKPFFESKMESKVGDHKDLIEKEALKQQVDANLVKAIMYMETTHGWYEAPAAAIDKNKSILPMNVRADYWADLGFSREELKEPEHNIAAGVLLIKRIGDRVPSPTVERVATLYQDLGATSVTDYGSRVQAIYDEQTWAQ